MTNFTSFPIPTKSGFEALLTQKAQQVADDAQAAQTAATETALLLPFISVVSFGALGDGTDQTAEINAALDSVPAEGGTVFLPVGHYVVSGPLRPKSKTTLMGAGRDKVLIELAPGSDSRIIFNATPVEGNEDIHLRDFSIEGNGEQQDDDNNVEAIILQNVKRCSIQYVNISNVRHHGVSLDLSPGGDGVEDFYGAHIVIDRVSGDGFEIEGVVRGKWEYVTVRRAGDISTQISAGTTPAAFEIEEGSRDLEFFRCQSIDCGIGGFNFQLAPVCENILISECHVKGSLGHGNLAGFGIRVVSGSEKVRNLRVINSVFEDCTYIMGREAVPGAYFQGCRFLRCNGIEATRVAGEMEFINCDFIAPTSGDPAFETQGDFATSNIFAGVMITGPGTKLRLSGCRIVGFVRQGVLIGTSAPGSEMVAENTLIQGNGREGILVNSAPKMRIQDCQIIGNGKARDSTGQRVGICWPRQDVAGLDFLIEGCVITDDGTGDQLFAIGSNTTVSGTQITEAEGKIQVTNCDLRGNATGAVQRPTAFSQSPLTYAARNRGWVTEAAGLATVEDGNTFVTVDHGLGGEDQGHPALSARHFSVTPTNSLGDASAFWVSDITATQFRINVDTDPGSAEATFAWSAMVPGR